MQTIFLFLFLFLILIPTAHTRTHASTANTVGRRWTNSLSFIFASVFCIPTIFLANCKFQTILLLQMKCILFTFQIKFSVWDYFFCCLLLQLVWLSLSSWQKAFTMSTFRKSQFYYLFLSSLFYFNLNQIIDVEWEFVATCSVIVVKFWLAITFFVINLQAMETYPTCLRQTGLSIGIIGSNIIGILGPYIVYLVS